MTKLLACVCLLVVSLSTLLVRIDGGAIQKVSAADGLKQTMTMTSDNAVNSFDDCAVYMNGLPVIEINFTDFCSSYLNDRYRGIDRDERRGATMTVSNTSEKFEFQDQAIQIRGRGNSSWLSHGDKRPYQIRFNGPSSNHQTTRPSPTNQYRTRYMFNSSYAARTWTLIANAIDATFMRNYSAYYLGGLLRMPFSPYGWFVQLYLNGEYRGVYMLSDHINVHDGGRMEDMVMSQDPYQTEFLLEMCQRLRRQQIIPMNTLHPDENMWTYVGGKSYRLTWPDYGDLTQAHMTRFREIIQSVDDLLGRRSNADHISRSQLEAVMDVESFVDFYLIHELFKNSDVGYSSMRYQIRIQDGVQRIVAGPVWDFDVAAGNTRHPWARGYRDYHRPTGIWAARCHRTGIRPAIWFNNLMRNEWFQREARERWHEIRNNEVRQMRERIWGLAMAHSECFDRNFTEAWPNWIGQLDRARQARIVAPVRRANTHLEHVEHLTDWIDDRIVWMDGFLENPNPYLNRRVRIRPLVYIGVSAVVLVVFSTLGFATFFAVRKNKKRDVEVPDEA